MSLNYDHIFQIESDQDFEQLALACFHHQFSEVPVYNQFARLLGRTPKNVKSLTDIPFLPIELFKKHIIRDSKRTEITFTSSGTTGNNTSCHYVNSLKLYEQSFTKAFKQFYGDIKEWTIIGLLPSYLEREGSSLIYMVDKLIESSESKHSQFCLKPNEEVLKILKAPAIKVLVIGVSYALMDLADQNLGPYPSTLFMETGGMKGKRKELIKSELHTYLKKGLKADEIHSEYGMTELLSQAYSHKSELFSTPNWMKVLIREIDDPLSYRSDYRTGGINVIDLANYHSCSFIATQDLGQLAPNNQFKVMGRFDHSDVRGCNLMVE